MNVLYVISFFGMILFILSNLSTFIESKMKCKDKRDGTYRFYLYAFLTLIFISLSVGRFVSSKFEKSTVKTVKIESHKFFAVTPSGDSLFVEQEKKIK